MPSEHWTEEAFAREFWTARDVAKYLGIKEVSVTKAVSRMGVSGEFLYPASQIRRAASERPGKGNRNPRTSVISED